MSDIKEILGDVLDDLTVIQTIAGSLADENERLTFENGALRERLRLSEEESPPAVPYSDDELDAVQDREREHEWERSTDRYDRGARD